MSITLSESMYRSEKLYRFPAFVILCAATMNGQAIFTNKDHGVDLGSSILLDFSS